MTRKRGRGDLEGGAEEEDGNHFSQVHESLVPIFSQLHESLVTRIIARIPYPNLFRARCLSKHWRLQLSDTGHNTGSVRFFQTQVALASGAWACYDPVICCDGVGDVGSYVTGYDACTRKWRTLWVLKLHSEKGDPFHFGDSLRSRLTLAGPLVSFCHLDDDVVPGRVWTEVVNVVTGKFTRLTSSFLDESGGNEFVYPRTSPKYQGAVLHGYPDGFVLAFVLASRERKFTYLLVMFDSRKLGWYRELIEFRELAQFGGGKPFVGVCEQLQNDSKLTFHVWRKGDQTFEFREFDVLTREWSKCKAKLAFNLLLSSDDCSKFEDYRLMFSGSRAFLLAWTAQERTHQRAVVTYKLHVLEYFESEGLIRHVSDHVFKTDEGFEVDFSCGQGKLDFGIPCYKRQRFCPSWTILSYDVQEGIWTSVVVPSSRELMFRK